MPFALFIYLSTPLTSRLGTRAHTSRITSLDGRGQAWTPRRSAMCISRLLPASVGYTGFFSCTIFYMNRQLSNCTSPPLHAHASPDPPSNVSPASAATNCPATSSRLKRPNDIYEWQQRECRSHHPPSNRPNRQNQPIFVTTGDSAARRFRFFQRERDVEECHRRVGRVGHSGAARRRRGSMSTALRGE